MSNGPAVPDDLDPLDKVEDEPSTLEGKVARAIPLLLNDDPEEAIVVLDGEVLEAIPLLSRDGNIPLVQLCDLLRFSYTCREVLEALNKVGEVAGGVNKLGIREVQDVLSKAEMYDAEEIHGMLAGWFGEDVVVRFEADERRSWDAYDRVMGEDDPSGDVDLLVDGRNDTDRQVERALRDGDDPDELD